METNLTLINEKPSKKGSIFKQIIASLLFGVVITGILAFFSLYTLQLYIRANSNYESAKQLISYSSFDIGSSITILELERLPNEHLQMLIDAGWKIKIPDETIEELFPDVSDTVGVTVPSLKTIFLEADVYQLYFTTIHEVGHVVDLIYGLRNYRTQLSYTSEFEDIYNAECGNAREYAQSNVKEFWADLYMTYVLDKEKCQKLYPMGTRYLEDNAFAH